MQYPSKSYYRWDMPSRSPISRLTMDLGLALVLDGTGGDGIGFAKNVLVGDGNSRIDEGP